MIADNVHGAIVVSGGTGVVGRSLLEQLGHLPVIALTHRQTLEPRPGLQQIQCDLTQSNLGLDPATFQRLARSTRAVIHCAAATDFNAAAADVRRINLAGTKEMLELAKQAGAVIYHLSSAFVDRATDAKVVSGTQCADGRDAYLTSKIDSEDLLRRKAHPHVIVRPSLLIGDSRTGQIHRQQGLHSLLGAYCYGALPFLPFEERTLVDFVPQDAVAQALITLVENGTSSGEYWLTGGTSAMSVSELTGAARRILADEAGREIGMPRYFSIETLNRLILPAFLDCFDKHAQRLFENLVALASLFPTDRVFPSDFGRGPLESVRMEPATLPNAVDAAIRRYFLPKILPREVAA